MRPLLVDATTLIALGQVGELDLLLHFEADVVVFDTVADEVTTDPAATGLERFRSNSSVRSGTIDEALGDLMAEPPSTIVPEARRILGVESSNGDVYIVAGVLASTERSTTSEPAAVVSDDSRVRTVADGLGATITGTIGVVVRAVHEGLPPSEARTLIRRIDDQGLHMTGELRETAYRLIDEAAEKRE